MQVCISLQTDNHACTPLLSFLQAGCPSCHPTNSVKALKAVITGQTDRWSSGFALSATNAADMINTDQCDTVTNVLKKQSAI